MHSACLSGASDVLCAVTWKESYISELTGMKTCTTVSAVRHTYLPGCFKTDLGSSPGHILEPANTSLPEEHCVATRHTLRVPPFCCRHTLHCCRHTLHCCRLTCCCCHAGRELQCPAPTVAASVSNSPRTPSEGSGTPQVRAEQTSACGPTFSDPLQLGCSCCKGQ